VTGGSLEDSKEALAIAQTDGNLSVDEQWLKLYFLVVPF